VICLRVDFDVANVEFHIVAEQKENFLFELIKLFEDGKISVNNVSLYELKKVLRLAG
jgi:hypothetical protein